jgi:hypothetical protein
MRRAVSLMVERPIAAALSESFRLKFVFTGNLKFYCEAETDEGSFLPGAKAIIPFW